MIKKPNGLKTFDIRRVIELVQTSQPKSFSSCDTFETVVGNCIRSKQKNLGKSHEIVRYLSSANVQSQLNLIYKKIKQAEIWPFLLATVPFLAVFQ